MKSLPFKYQHELVTDGKTAYFLSGAVDEKADKATLKLISYGLKTSQQETLYARTLGSEINSTDNSSVYAYKSKYCLIQMNDKMYSLNGQTKKLKKM